MLQVYGMKKMIRKKGLKSMNKEIVLALVFYFVIGWILSLFFITFHEKIPLTKSIKNLILIPIATPLILILLPFFKKTTKRLVVDSINRRHPESSEEERIERQEIINKELTRFKLFETTLRILFNLPRLFKIQANLIVSASRPDKNAETKTKVVKDETESFNLFTDKLNRNLLFISFRRVLVERIDNNYS